ncbi:MAG: glycerophosphodiester phosphodiesterase [Lachnospiraceae bacterium]|nr:glycerophosphodiester phosphodiesterase [Lachnospiraceae bacterium]MBO5144213.1 glycerophosphodiester phosphodiesterase [Lachnospiraceae bacterium]
MKLLYILLMIFLILLFLFGLYLISIKPRLHGRPDYKPFYGHMYAHRGLHNMNPALQRLKTLSQSLGQGMEPNLKLLQNPEGNFPENSYAAIKRAADLGYGIEFDVHLTKDNIPVVFHDDTLNRICGVRGNLKDYTFEELQQFRLLGTDERIPAFADILKMIDGRVPLIIEYKVEKNADRLCSICDRILSDYKGLYCIESFHPMAVRWYKIHRPNIVRGQLSEDFTRQKLNLPYFLLSHLIGNCYASPDFIAYNCKHKNELSRNICRKLYKSLSVAWTVRSQEELETVSRSFDLFIFEDFVPARRQIHTSASC